MTSLSITATLLRLERAHGLSLTTLQRSGLEEYLRLIRQWNRLLNLTSLEPTEQILRLHFLEAFWAAQNFLPDKTLLGDVGSGAGFPGLAMKLYRPSLQVTLIEKSYKKVVFLREVSGKLGLEVDVFHGRGETFPDWGVLRVATVRALCPTPGLLRAWSAAGVQVLYFHGKELRGAVAELPVLQQAKVPESRNRYVSLLEC